MTQTHGPRRHGTFSADAAAGAHPLAPAASGSSTTTSSTGSRTATLHDPRGGRRPVPQPRRSLEILGDHGAQVDAATPGRALPARPRPAGPGPGARATFTMARPEPRPSTSSSRTARRYFTTDGCGVATIDLGHAGWSGRRARSDVARDGAHRRLPARRSASCGRRSAPRTTGRTSQLHEMDAALQQHGQALPGHGHGRRRRPASPSRWRRSSPAAARPSARGRPSRTSSAPSRRSPRTTRASSPRWSSPRPGSRWASCRCRRWARPRPSTSAGALVVGDAEVISGIVLLQLAYPGAPVFHSIMKAWADPRTGNYVGYSARQPHRATRRSRWPTTGACRRSARASARTRRPPGTWQAAAEVALDPLLGGLAGPGARHGHGPRPHLHPALPGGRSSSTTTSTSGRATRSWRLDVDDETLALDVIANVGPGGHYLAEEHTRTHMRTSLKRGLDPRPASSGRLPRPDRGRPRAGGLDPREPPPGAARDGQGRGADPDPGGGAGRDAVTATPGPRGSVDARAPRRRWRRSGPPRTAPLPRRRAARRPPGGDARDPRGRSASTARRSRSGAQYAAHGALVDDATRDRPPPARPRRGRDGAGAARLHDGRARPRLRPASSTARRSTSPPTAAGSGSWTATPGPPRVHHGRRGRHGPRSPTRSPRSASTGRCVSAQDHPATAPLHELARVVSQHRQARPDRDGHGRAGWPATRWRWPASSPATRRRCGRGRRSRRSICAIAPLAQDDEGMEARPRLRRGRASRSASCRWPTAGSTGPASIAGNRRPGRRRDRRRPRPGPAGPPGRARSSTR